MKVIFFLADWISLTAYSVLIFLVLKEFVPLRFRNRFFHILEIACLIMGCNAIVYPGGGDRDGGKPFCDPADPDSFP